MENDPGINIPDVVIYKTTYFSRDMSGGRAQNGRNAILFTAIDAGAGQMYSTSHGTVCLCLGVYCVCQCIEHMAAQARSFPAALEEPVGVVRRAGE